MSPLADAPPTPMRLPQDSMLAGEVISHLELQLSSARRLLAIVLDQGKAIRRREVQEVVRQAGLLAVEMHRGRSIEEARTRLLERAGVACGSTRARHASSSWPP